MTNETISAGEALRVKHRVRNSSELALRVARNRGLISRGCGSANMGKEYISPDNNFRSGLCIEWEAESASRKYWVANRILWARGLTIGGDNWYNGDISDLGNRIKILDGCHRAEQGWLSGWHEERGRNEDKRCNDGKSTWYRSYACHLLKRVYGSKGGFREGFDYDPEYLKRLGRYYQEHPRQLESEFVIKINKAIANRFFEESVGTFGKIGLEERREIAEIYAEVNLGRSPAQLDRAIQMRDVINNHLGSLMPYTKTGRISECLEVAGFGEKKWKARAITASQWEDYKRAYLNPNPTFLDKLYQSVYRLSSG